MASKDQIVVAAVKLLEDQPHGLRYSQLHAAIRGVLPALARIFGIGLILFDATGPKDPKFEIRVRAAKVEPDMFYVNRCMKLVEDQLFS